MWHCFLFASTLQPTVILLHRSATGGRIGVIEIRQEIRSRDRTRTLRWDLLLPLTPWERYGCSQSPSKMFVRVSRSTTRHRIHRICRTCGRLRLRPTVKVYSRSEEHTSELQSLMRISNAVFCLNKKNNPHRHYSHLRAPTHTPATTN